MSVPESNYRAWLRKAEHDLLFKPIEDDGPAMKETGPPGRRASSRPAFVTLISRPAAAAAAQHP